MKKSSLIILAGILAAIITLAAADLKLKKEYDAKNIKEYLIYKPLPPFHYIKDDFNGKRTYEWYICNIRSDKKYGVGIGFVVGNRLEFVVKNDTLFIQKPVDAALNDIVYGLPVTIFTGPLKGVSARVCQMTITGKMDDTIRAVATDKAEIKFEHLVTHSLAVETDKNATVTLSATDTLQNLHLQLRSTSSFTSNNVFIANKILLLGDSASLKLSGRSLDNFGIRKN
ncbi:MAG: hypothetical protein V4539_02755 [Bacteroidota bacterium]